MQEGLGIIHAEDSVCLMGSMKVLSAFLKVGQKVILIHTHLQGKASLSVSSAEQQQWLVSRERQKSQWKTPSCTIPQGSKRYVWNPRMNNRMSTVSELSRHIVPMV